MPAAFVLASANPGVFNNAFSGTTALTFASINGGVNIPAGVKFTLHLSQDQGNLADPGSITIGGNALIKAAGDTSGTGAKTELWYADILSACADTLVINVPANAWNVIGIECGWLTGAALGAPSATSQSVFGADGDNGTLPPAGLAVSANVPSGGVAVVGLWSSGSGTVGTGSGVPVTWTNATGNTPKFFGSSQQTVIASTTTAGSPLTVQANGGTGLQFESGMVMASWGAASGGGDTFANAQEINFI